jgi:hypothetical protein
MLTSSNTKLKNMSIPDTLATAHDMECLHRTDNIIYTECRHM